MTSERRRGPSIEDVAREAGVSVATVSRALRGLPNVAESTRVRVEDVARQLRYRADPSAARLATGRTQLVQIAAPELDGWSFSRMIAGAVDRLRAEGYEAIAQPVADPEARSEFLADLMHIEKRVDGVIVIDLHISDDQASLLREAGVPMVTAGSTTPAFPSVVIDDVEVGRQATRHLLDLGHRRIGLISGEPNHPLEFSVPGFRHMGYVAALAEFGIDYDETLERSGRFTATGGREAMAELLGLDDPPTAVFAMSDEMALGAWRALQDAGLSWPHDVAVVGVDGHELAEMVDLTTLRLAHRRLGAAAADALLASMAAAPDDEIIRLVDDPGWIELVPRASTVGERR